MTARRHDPMDTRARAARRAAALRRPELSDRWVPDRWLDPLPPPVAFAATGSPSGPPVKVLDPALRRLIDDAMASRGQRR